jgi:hypothetical protein
MKRVDMKRFIIILNCLLLFSTGLLLAQSVQEQPMREKILEWEKQLEVQFNLRSVFLNKSDSLNSAIQNLKGEKRLNVFQRQQLENLFKISQQNDAKLRQVDHEIIRQENQYQIDLKNIVGSYEQKIDSMLTTQKQNPAKFEASAINELAGLKSVRDFYLKKLKPRFIQKVPENTISISEFDSYQKIRQKADLLKDHEEKIREQKRLLSSQTADLENELKLRSRMNELVTDTYLMDFNPEIPSQSVLAVDEKSGSNATFNNDNIFREGYMETDTTPLDATDILILYADVSEVSTLDLEQYIQRLRLVEKQLGNSADSLQIKANQFYQAAEMKKKEIEK